MPLARCSSPSVRRANDLQVKIKAISEGEYAVAKQDVDRLRQELGQPALPSLQSTLEEKSAECVHTPSRLTCRLTIYCSPLFHPLCHMAASPRFPR